MSTDSAVKARYCAAMCASARALVDAIPDDYVKRMLSRSIFLHLVEFIPLARETRNDAKPRARRPAAAALVAIKQRLTQLADRDWAPYAPLRDRLAAHRQPLADDDPTSWGASALLWSEVDSSLVGILVDDVLGIWKDLAPIVGQPAVVAPTLDPTLASAAGSAIPGAAPGLAVASGGLGMTRPDTVGMIQGGPLGERMREINETLDHFEQLDSLYPVVQGNEALRRIIVGALVIETCGLVELMYDVPAGRAPKDYYPPLIDLVDAASPASVFLTRGRSALDTQAVADLRQVRNEIAAHVDQARLLADLLRMLDGLDLGIIARVGNDLTATVSAVAVTDPVFATLRLRGIRIDGVSREPIPELGRPF